MRGQRASLLGNVGATASYFEQAVGETAPGSLEYLLTLADVPPGKRAPRDLATARKLSAREYRANLLASLSGEPDPRVQAAALEKMLQLDPDESMLRVEAAFRRAALGHWSNAAELLRQYGSRGHRVCASSLAAALLEAEVQALTGRKDAALAQLQGIVKHRDWPWYPTLTQDLLNPKSGGIPGDLRPPQLLTMTVARGLRAEAAGDRAAAMRNYQTALETNLATWSEYRFAERRITVLRNASSAGERER